MTDTERLEWLVKHRALVHSASCTDTSTSYFVVYRNGTTSYGCTDFREAIDKAIKETNYIESMDRMPRLIIPDPPVAPEPPRCKFISGDIC